MRDLSHFPSHLHDKLLAHNAIKSLRRNPRLYSDTSSFTTIDYGDVIYVDGKYFLVVGYTREGRFGIDEQPKQWVPKVLNIETGERKIMKLVFHESFKLKLGGLDVSCYRSPEKEGKVLELIRNNPYFMQGYSVVDEVGNLVRILDIIHGKRLDNVIAAIPGSHKYYIEHHVEEILRKFLVAVEAIDVLHTHNFKHGDIRRDHLYVDYENGLYRWIDFDYDFYLPERPFALDLIGLGNILLYILGQRNFRPIDVLQHPKMGEEVLACLDAGDLSLLGRDRIFNLQKLYPYIPGCFNDLLLHFSAKTTVMYDNVAEFHEDLARCINSIYG